MIKEWQLLPAITADFIAANPDISPVILQLLYNRGLKEGVVISKFLSGRLEENLSVVIGDSSAPAFYDPFLFKHMSAAVDLIIKHIKAGSKIIVYGDYDADGVTSSVILSEALKILHGVIEIYLPDRVSEGYGLNKPAISQLAAQGVKLIITVDNGIRNKEEVAYAKKLGLDIIITDHHVLPEDPRDLPDCLYINPSDVNDHYPWRYLAGVGVAYKLVSALLIKANIDSKQKQLISEKCLDLVAVGTIADMVSLLGENRLLVKEGLQILNQNKRLGLNELLKISKVNQTKDLEAWNVGWQIAPRLNAASRLAHANTAFALLSTTDPVEAQELASELNQRNISRQKITEEIAAQVEAQIDPNNLPLVIIGVAGEGQVWNEGVVGLVAGRIAEKYYRPTLVVSRLVEEAEFDPQTKKLVPKKLAFKGSGRSVEEFNLIQAIEASSQWLDKYGGHPMACGFFLKGEDNLRAFRENLLRLAAVGLSSVNLVPKLKIERELKFAEIDLELAKQVNSLAPFGQNNQQPRFVSYNLRVDDFTTMGFEHQHIKLRLSNLDEGSGRSSAFWALAFGGASVYKDVQVGDYVDLVYYLEINEFNGRSDIQLKIVDLKLRTNN
jgi:single-stranded-DNA-specific exonuclease